MRNEIYYLPIGIYDMNIEAIRVAQHQWLEQAVIARDDSSGFYYPGMLSVVILYNADSISLKGTHVIYIHIYRNCS